MVADIFHKLLSFGKIREIHIFEILKNNGIVCEMYETPKTDEYSDLYGNHTESQKIKIGKTFYIHPDINTYLDIDKKDNVAKVEVKSFIQINERDEWNLNGVLAVGISTKCYDEYVKLEYRTETPTYIIWVIGDKNIGYSYYWEKLSVLQKLKTKESFLIYMDDRTKKQKKTPATFWRIKDLNSNLNDFIDSVKDEW